MLFMSLCNNIYCRVIFLNLYENVVFVNVFTPVFFVFGMFTN